MANSAPKPPKNITELFPMSPKKTLANFEIDEIKYFKFQKKLKKQKITMRNFFETMVDKFLEE